MKKLGFGLMRLPLLDPNDADSIDIEQVKKMVDVFLQRGFTYFDTAWMYCNFNSESIVKTALTERHPRESFTLATKLHDAFFHSMEDRDKVFYAQLEKTGAGYFDYYLLHGIESGTYPKYEEFDCFNWLLQKKEMGLVRHAGFSYHDNAELLDEILTKHPEMEFVQLQMNYLDWDSEWIQSRACYEVATKHGKPVIVMEPVKGGTLSSLPEDMDALLKAKRPDMSASSWAVRFAATPENVMVVLSGMSNMEQLMDNTCYMQDFVPLDDAEQALVKQVADRLRQSIAIPCTGCAYCTTGCPQRIAIPQYFSLYNDDMRETVVKPWTANFPRYADLAKKFGKAADCIGCGQCESVCPQHLPIISHLHSVSERFDR
ncbi:MAG: aldo/keto reductase [Clostridia bacterium]|nr:aldo/keto reductase [Clostridia bacterium]